MALKDVLVHIDDDPGSAVRLHLACEIARRQAAHLTGLHCIAPLQTTMYSPWGAPGYSDFTAIQQIQEQYHVAALAATAKLESTFHSEVERARVSSEWRVIEGVGAVPLIEQARYADLVITGQADVVTSSLRTISPEEIVLFCGRPTLIVPRVGRFEHLGRRVFIAWDASREAARAVGDAMPLLVYAEAVTVLSVNAAPGIDGKQPAIDLAHHLARHGVQAEAADTVVKQIAVGEVLLARAADFGADLIVMGAYGHSRSRELLLGGPTRHVLQHMTAPVLMAH